MAAMFAIRYYRPLAPDSG